MSTSTSQGSLPGVLAPVVTPFTTGYEPDAARLVAHCKWLQAQACGLAIFGTNSEGNSMSVPEKIDLMDQLLEAGIDPGVMMPGTGACAIPDAGRLSAHWATFVLTRPLRSDAVADRLPCRVRGNPGRRQRAAPRLPLPHSAGGPGGLQPSADRAPGEGVPSVVAGIKDSSGDWENTRAIIEALPGWGVYAGNEKVLLKTMQAGGVGCISATCNVNAGAIVELHRMWQTPDAERRQEKCNALRAIFEGYPVIPAMKWAIAHYSGDPAWRSLRPPLVELDIHKGEELIGKLDAHGFAMPGLEAA